MDQVCLKPIGIILTSFIIFYYFIHIGKRIVVNQLEYAASLLQTTDLCASSNVYRFEIIISKKIPQLATYIYVYVIQGFLCDYQWYKVL